MINSTTRLVGLMGWPVNHSRSPAMQNAAFAALGLDYAYVALPVPPGQVPAAVHGLAALSFAGANVTIPHKEAVLPYVDEASPTARAIGSANTLVIRPDGSVWADSTDGSGFLAHLRAQGVEPGGQPVVLLGAGGSARAVTYALAEVGAQVFLCNRTVWRAEAICAAIKRALPGADVSAYPFPDALARLAPQARLIVNCTSLGLHGTHDPLPWDPAVPFRENQVVCDLVYRPRGLRAGPTPLLALASEQGARVLDGLGMLVQQGARSFELWTGLAAPLEVMYRAAGAE